MRVRVPVWDSSSACLHGTLVILVLETQKSNKIANPKMEAHKASCVT